MRELDKQSFLLKEEILELKYKLAESERINNKLYQELEKTKEQLTGLEKLYLNKDEDINEQMRLIELDV